MCEIHLTTCTHKIIELMTSLLWNLTSEYILFLTWRVGMWCYWCSIIRTCIISTMSHRITWLWIMKYKPGTFYWKEPLNHMTMNNELNVIFEEGNYMFIYYVLNALYSGCPIKPVWDCLALISAELSSLIRW